MSPFTVAEAEALLPEIEKVLKTIDEIVARAERKAARVRELEANPDKNAPELAIERAQLEFLSNGIGEWLQKIADLGAVPKGVAPALVDFPGELAGREVYLCWQRGETAITHYHGVDEGFAGRKPLPRRKPS